MMYKKITIALLAFFSIGFFSSASHMAGFNISYECISPGNYRISMIVYRDCSGIPFNPSTVQIAFKSKCDQLSNNCPMGTITGYLTPGSGLAVEDECIDTEATTCFGGSRYGVERYEYEAIWSAPAGISNDCQEWYFYWGDAARNCCRNASTTLRGGTQQVFAYLNNKNNVTPCNTSAASEVPYIPAFCPGQKVTLKVDWVDADNDQLKMVWTPCLREDGCDSVIADYSAPFTYLNPGNSGCPWMLDSTTGYITWLPTQIETDVVCYRIEEWRGATLVGWTMFDFQVRVDPDPIVCAQNKVPTYKKDTVKLACAAKRLNFDLTTDVHCSSLTPEGTEWRMYSAQSGQAIPVTASRLLNCNVLTNISPEVQIDFYEPLLENGYYYLYPKEGDDLNTMGNQCRKYMEEFDTLVVKVEGCYEYNEKQELINVSVNSITNEDIFVKWLAPQGIDTDLFESVNLYRSRDGSGGNWEELKIFNDITTLTFEDIDPLVLPINASNYYAISVSYKVVDGFPYTKETEKSNQIASIHLANNPMNTDINALDFNLTWNDYLGWGNDLYEVEITDEVIRSWDIDGNTQQLSYLLIKPAENGKYLVRNYTDNTHPSAGDLRAYSNWIPLQVPKRDLVIPNIITPNGDDKNDIFNILNIDFYPNTSVKIYNRWGNEVYNTENYVNDPSKAFGKQVKTGVYYWVVQVPEEEERKGVVKVIN